MLNTINRLVTPVLLLCAILVTSLVVKRELFGSGAGPSSRPAAPSNIKNWKELAAEGTIIGPATAPVTITEFSDFQCPWCKKFHEALRQVFMEYPNELAVSFRHLPIERIHKHARNAAYASECAARQGRFAGFADVAFAKQDSIGLLSFGELGQRAGVADTAALINCMKDPAIAARVAADMEAAREIKATGTPTVIINGKRLAGGFTVESLRVYIDESLPKRKK